MLPEELVALVKKVQRSRAEGPGLAVKTAHEDCPKLYDTLSSFSNQACGGTILFGLSEKENFAVIGVKDVQSLQKSVTDRCSRPFEWSLLRRKSMERWFALLKYPDWILRNGPAIIRGAAG